MQRIEDPAEVWVIREEGISGEAASLAQRLITSLRIHPESLWLLLFLSQGSGSQLSVSPMFS